MKSKFSRYKRLSGPIIMVAMLMICLISSCRKVADPQLIEIDALMESRPDSALTLLEGYRLTPDSPSSDSAYFALLLTHARYKNFIDEIDDSLISKAADWFEKHGDTEKASRALFLQGMILFNAQRLGDAAVSFSKGLDIAHDGKYYMWEGQCARGLFFLYRDLMNGSEQLIFAQKESEAFQRLLSDDWHKYAQLDLATAYNNNGQYEAAISIAERLKDNEEDENDPDSALLAETYLLLGISNFCMDKHAESLDNYSKAYMHDPTIISDATRLHLSISANEIGLDSLSSEIKDMIQTCDTGNGEYMYGKLAREHNYEAAYKTLLRYKNQQDSVLSKILVNNVSGSLTGYQDAVRLKSELDQKRKKGLALFGFLLAIMIAVIVVLWYRERVQRSKEECQRLQAAMEALKADFLSKSIESEKYESQAGAADELTKAEDIRMVTKRFKKILKDKYSEMDAICDDYYQSSSKKDMEKARAQMEKSIRKFNSESSLKEIEEYVDGLTSGLYTSFNREFLRIGSDNKRMYLFQMLGFSPLSICVLIGLEKDVMYNRKSRLKKRIQESDSARKEEYLMFF